MITANPLAVRRVEDLPALRPDKFAEKIIEQARTARDFVVRSPLIRMGNDGLLAIPDRGGDKLLVQPNDLMGDQIAGRLRIPREYYQRMKQDAPVLLARNVNHWMESEEDAQRLIRTYGTGPDKVGVGRAMLSSKYRPLDNLLMVTRTVDIIQSHNLRLIKAELTERRLFLRAVSHLTVEAKKGDPVAIGVQISNSETGCGSLSVESFVMVLHCLNGAVGMNLVRKRHTGGRLVDDENDASEVYTRETMTLSDRALWAQVADLTRHAVSEQFAVKLERDMRKAAGTELKSDIPDVLEVTAKHLGLREGEKDLLADASGKEWDGALWGLVQSLTRASQSIEKFDRRNEVERAAWDLLQAPPKAILN